MKNTAFYNNKEADLIWYRKAWQRRNKVPLIFLENYREFQVIPNNRYVNLKLA